MWKQAVFERSGEDTMSRNAFFLVVGVVLAFGFGLSALAANYTATWVPASQTEMWWFLGLGLGLPFLGILLSISNNAFISFIGFNLVAVPFGAVLGPVLHAYTVEMPGVVTEALLLTGGTAGVMALSGLMFPKFYETIGGALFTALIALVIVSVAALFIPGLGQLIWIDYAAAALFALYIGYDMHRATRIPATLDNAIDTSIALYLDILNLFLRILRILGRSRS